MKKITFTDDSYIEKNISGFICVGLLANEFGHMLRKLKIDNLEYIAKALNTIKDGNLIIKSTN